MNAGELTSNGGDDIASDGGERIPDVRDSDGGEMTPQQTEGIQVMGRGH